MMEARSDDRSEARLAGILAAVEQATDASVALVVAHVVRRTRTGNRAAARAADVARALRALLATGAEDIYAPTAAEIASALRPSVHAPSTQRRTWTMLRAFYRSAIDLGVCQSDPTREVRASAAQNARTTPLLDVPDLAMVLDVAAERTKRRSDAIGYRDLMVVALPMRMLLTTARLRRLRWRDWATDALLVHDENMQRWRLDIPDDVGKLFFVLRAELERAIRRRVLPEDAVVPSLTTASLRGAMAGEALRPLSPVSLSEVIRDLLGAAGLHGQGIASRSLRFSAARGAFVHGASITDIALLLRRRPDRTIHRLTRTSREDPSFDLIPVRVPDLGPTGAGGGGTA